MFDFLTLFFLISPTFSRIINSNTIVENKDKVKLNEELDVVSSYYLSFNDVKSIKIDGDIYNNGSIYAYSSTSQDVDFQFDAVYNDGKFIADLNNGKFSSKGDSFHNTGDIHIHAEYISIDVEEFYNDGHLQYYNIGYPAVKVPYPVQNYGAICYKNSVDALNTEYYGDGCIVLDNSQLYANEKFSINKQVFHVSNDSHVFFDQSLSYLLFSGLGNDNTIGSFTELTSFKYDSDKGILSLTYDTTVTDIYIGFDYDESKFERVTYSGKYDVSDYNSIKYNGPPPHEPYYKCTCRDQSQFKLESECETVTVSTTIYDEPVTKTITITETITPCYTHVYTYTQDYKTYTGTCITDVETFTYYHSYLYTYTYVDATTTVWYTTYTTDTYTCHETASEYESNTTEDSEISTTDEPTTSDDSITSDNSSTLEDSTTSDESSTWDDLTTLQESSTSILETIPTTFII